MAYEPQIKNMERLKKEAKPFKLGVTTAEEAKEASLLDAKNYYGKRVSLDDKIAVMKLKSMCPAVVQVRYRSVFSDDDAKFLSWEVLDFDKTNTFFIYDPKSKIRFGSRACFVQVGLKNSVKLVFHSEKYYEIVKIKPLERQYKPYKNGALLRLKAVKRTKLDLGDVKKHVKLVGIVVPDPGTGIWVTQPSLWSKT